VLSVAGRRDFESDTAGREHDVEVVRAIRCAYPMALLDAPIKRRCRDCCGHEFAAI
jgi:hypothetical protein